ncbi:spore coat protein [Virgibacillus ndiopensis]|uniref:spore coat protein n=1 Tax=Virgibacillus ndiopensis TaxID=2004408 RepID=UPI00159BC4F4|nr:spore coat protein [Virgibacillus ndiopensis]
MSKPKPGQRRTVVIERQCRTDNNCDNGPREWSALDASCNHPMDATVEQGQDSKLSNAQHSYESIVVKDSCDIEVSSNDTQAAINVQVALQVAIALVISISIADSNTANEITQDLNAKLKSSQVNSQQVYIQNSRGVNITTTDTDIAVNIQLLLQVLIAIVLRLDIL